MAPALSSRSDFVTMSVLWCAFAALGIAVGMFADGRSDELEQAGPQVGILTQDDLAEFACSPTVTLDSAHIPGLAEAERLPTRVTALRGDAGEIRYLLKTPDFEGGHETRIRLYTFVVGRSSGDWCVETLDVADQFKSPEVQASE